MHCSLAAVQVLWASGCAGIDVSGYWRDRANHNLIHGNWFSATKIDVQDGPNTIYANEFISTELELGKGQPLGWSTKPVTIDGIIAENVFDEGSRIDLATTGAFNNLEFFNNRDASGECLALLGVCVGSGGSFNYAECLAERVWGTDSPAQEQGPQRWCSPDQRREGGTLPEYSCKPEFWGIC